MKGQEVHRTLRGELIKGPPVLSQDGVRLQSSKEIKIVQSLMYKEFSDFTYWPLFKSNGSSPHEGDATQVNQTPVSQDVGLFRDLRYMKKHADKSQTFVVTEDNSWQPTSYEHALSAMLQY